MTVESPGAASTEAAGADLAVRLGPGDVVLITGDLGAGKTTFVRGACRALGITEPVTSPTFTVGNLYTGSAPASVQVAHLDLYRVEDLATEDPDLLADYIGPPRVSFVEWPGGAESAIGRLGRVRFHVHLVHAGGDRRRITIDTAAPSPSLP